MIVSINTSGLKRGKWYEYATRFILGGLVTAGAAVLAKKFGDSFGGLFLAFPAILVASTTLVDKHERERKEEKGLSGVHRGRKAAGADAAGASMGSIGLIAFAGFVWKVLPSFGAWIAIGGASLLWAIISVGVWWVWKRKIVHGMSRRY